MNAIYWADQAPAFEVDGTGVNLTFQSGDERVAFRLSRHAFRRFVEMARRGLDEADRAQTAEISAIHGVCPFAADDRCL